jgi:hypothetical protein
LSIDEVIVPCCESERLDDPGYAAGVLNKVVGRKLAGVVENARELIGSVES